MTDTTAREPRDARRPEAGVEADLVKEAFARLPLSLLLTAGTTVVFGFMLWSFFPTLSMAAWVMTILATVAIRFLQWAAFKRAAPSPEALVYWRNHFLAGSLAAGAAWSLGPVMMMPGTGSAESALFVGALLSVCAVAVSTQASLRAAMQGFVLAAMVPTGIAFWMTGGRVEQVLALLLATGTTALLIVGRRSSMAIRVLIETQARMRESEELYRTAFQTSPDAVNITRLSDGQFLEVNEGFVRLLGRSRDEVMGKTILELEMWLDSGDRQRAAEALRPNGHFENLEARFVAKGGRVFTALVSAHVITLKGEQCVLSVARDVSERKQAEEKLQLAAKVFIHAREGITITDADGTIIDVNETFCNITGYSREEALGRNPRILSSGIHDKAFYSAMWRDLVDKGEWSGEVWNRRKSGELYAEMATISAVRDDQGITRQYVALFSNITSLKEHERELESIAHYDALTTLPNRVLLADRLHQAMVQTQRRGQTLGIVYLDLDGFKAVNDNHGHDIGDELLMSVAARMKNALRDGDTLARLGGDEFVAVLLDLNTAAAGTPVLARLLGAANEPVHVGDLVLKVSASIGVTFYPQPEDIDADQLLRQADQAMYQAKLAGKNRYHIFDAEQDRSARGHHESVEHIRLALAQDEFVLHYQPKVNMRTGSIIGAEALIRWQHPERGLLAPGIFLPVIEDHPLAVQLGEWVIDTALTQMDAWRAAGLEIPVSVNVAARQLQQADFVERLRSILATHRHDGRCALEIEVLETSALEDLSRITQIIVACRELGVSFALDDFGTGYSSLTYLKHLPVSLLKIDQSFVRDMLDDPDDLAILQGVLGLARAFRRDVIAEGVETVEHGTLLLHLGCEQAQGYGIARPMPANDFPAWSESWRPDSAWLDLGPVEDGHLPLIVASVEHRAWVRAVEEHLKGERTMPPSLNHHQCHLGVWLDGKGRSSFGTQPVFQAVLPMHEHIHELVGELCELHSAGRVPEAAARLVELHGLRDAILEQLKALEQVLQQSPGNQ